MQEIKRSKGFALVNLQGGIVRKGRIPSGQLEIYPQKQDAKARKNYINSFSTQKVRIVKVDILY